MTTAQIEKLIKHLPPDAPFLADFSGDFGGTNVPVQVDVWAKACNDPAFGSKFIDSFVRLGKPLPDSITEPEFRRVYAYVSVCGQSEDRDVREALALEHPQNTQRRILLRCLLLREEFDFAQIAQRMGLSVDTVRVYEALYWSVRGRDRIYLASLVYPQTRQVEWAPDYPLKETPMNLALRATMHEGISAAEQLLGLSNPVEDSGASDHAGALASRILSNANFMAKLGFLNQNLPATDKALRVLRAFKPARGQQPDHATKRQVNPVSPAMAVSESINRILTDIEGGWGVRLGRQPPTPVDAQLPDAA
jgi:hypothetical protein